MPNHRDILRELLANAPENLSDDDLAELAATAQTLARLGTKPTLSPEQQKAETERQKRMEYDAREQARARAKTDARQRLMEIDSRPLPPGSPDRLRLARAAERADLMATIHDLHDNGHFRPSGGGDAA